MTPSSVAPSSTAFARRFLAFATPMRFLPAAGPGVEGPASALMGEIPGMEGVGIADVTVEEMADGRR